MVNPRGRTIGPLWARCTSCGEERTLALYATPQVRGVRGVLTGRRSAASERTAVCLICAVRAREQVAALIPGPRAEPAPLGCLHQA